MTTTWLYLAVAILAEVAGTIALRLSDGFSGVGVALVAIIGALFLGDGLTWLQAGGVVLVIAGVIVLEAGATHG